MFRGNWRRGPWGPGWGYRRGPFYPPRRGGFPLLGGGGNTLVDSLLAGGLGYMVGKSTQQQQPPQQYQQPAPQYQPLAQQGTPADNRMAQLQQLGQLRASGVLTDAEFENEKQKILNGL